MTDQTVVRERRTPPAGLGRMLNEARLRAGLRGTEAARLTGVSRQYLVRLETGQRCPSVEVAERLAVVLQLTGAEAGKLMAAAAKPGRGRAA
jgi:transcriptional regulator with XRE-family HTH domain